MNQPADQRAHIENRLNLLHGLLRRFEGLEQQKETVYQRHQHRYAKYQTTWRAGMYWLWVLLFTIAFTIIVFSTAIPLSMNAAEESAGASMGFLALFLLPFPLALIAAGVFSGVRNAQIPKVNAKREQANQATANQIAEETWPEIAPIEAQLDQSRQEYQQGFRGWFPSKYLTSNDVGACWHIVHDHRASTVESAINAYETELHRQRLENLAASQLAEQQRATQAAKMGNMINAVGFGASIGTMRAEGAATRAALGQPRNVNVRFH